MDAAYTPGGLIRSPVVRTATLSRAFPDLLRRLRKSEAYREMENISQKTVEGKEITPALPEPPDASANQSTTI
jgi:hypothetical protein